MRIELWITEVKDTLSEYVILIAFPRQQWLRERAFMLRLYVMTSLLEATHRLSWNKKVHYCLVKIPSLEPTVEHMNSANTPPALFL
jgi:hypothetical protein